MKKETKKTKARILVTGGLGYIGSHTVIELCKSGFEPIIVDNLSNSSADVLAHLEELAGQPIYCEFVDILETPKLMRVMKRYKPTTVLHFAALKSPYESQAKPLDYYANNVGGTVSVLQAMKECDIKKIVFSSSAMVYGDIDRPATEDMELGSTNNAYGASKAQCERILKDVAKVYTDWSVTILRYFNPIGAHPSGMIGEAARGVPNNLLPYITQVAIGKLPHLSVYGDNYETPDGTCIRDYIHVVDLARGHVAALQKMTPGVSIYNLGTGEGHSVKELLHHFEAATGKIIPHQIVDRRSGDLPNVIADPAKALRELSWKAEHGLEDMCRDAWNWENRGLDNA